MTNREWVGSIPKTCGYCGTRLSDVFYDTRTTDGPWACLCRRCFNHVGSGLGSGLGQKYQKQPDGSWACVAG